MQGKEKQEEGNTEGRPITKALGVHIEVLKETYQTIEIIKIV